MKPRLLSASLGIGSVLIVTLGTFSHTALAFDVNGKTNKVSVNWAGQLVSNCYASNGHSSVPAWSGSLATAGNFIIPADTMRFNAPVSFTVYCQDVNYGTWYHDTVVLNVSYPPPIIQVAFQPTSTTANPLAPLPTLSFTASSHYLGSVASATLSWNFSDSSGTCVGSGGSGVWSGSRATAGTFGTGRHPGADIDYILTCTDSSGRQLSGVQSISWDERSAH